MPYEHVAFAHNAERQLARLFDFYALRWAYEPHTFVLERDEHGHATSAFAPDFWLPDHDRYLEVTTLDQRLVTKKNRKLRRLRALHPGIDVELIYQRDYRHLLVKYGLERPEQDRDESPVTSSMEPLGLLASAGVVVARPDEAADAPAMAPPSVA